MLTGYVCEGIHIALRYPHLMNSGPSKKLEETPLAPVLDFPVSFFLLFFFFLIKNPLSCYKLSYQKKKKKFLPSFDEERLLLDFRLRDILCLHCPLSLEELRRCGSTANLLLRGECTVGKWFMSANKVLNNDFLLNLAIKDITKAEWEFPAKGSHFSW